MSTDPKQMPPLEPSTEPTKLAPTPERAAEEKRRQEQAAAPKK